MEKANSKLSSKKIVEFVNVIPGNCSGQYFREMTGLYNKVLWTVAFVLGFYFLWMDIAMYHHIQNWSHNQKKSEGFDPFNPLTVKLITIDHFTHYIHTIGSEYFEIVTHFAEVFPNITPNMISFTHMTCAIIGGRLIACEKLHWRQVGVGLFQLRDFLDSLDGVVFRVHSKQRAFTSVWGTSGYMVDIMCDIVAGLALFAGVWTYFWRYPPMQPPQACLRMAEEGSVTKRPGDGRVSRRTVVTVLIAFGIRFLFIGGLWDHFVHKYHDQLEVTLPSPSQQASICFIVFSKRLGSRHRPIHKEIKEQDGMNGIDDILCKTDLNIFWRRTYKCNTFNDLHFEACFKSAYVPLW